MRLKTTINFENDAARVFDHVLVANITFENSDHIFIHALLNRKLNGTYIKRNNTKDAEEHRSQTKSCVRLGTNKQYVHTAE